MVNLLGCHFEFRYVLFYCSVCPLWFFTTPFSNPSQGTAFLGQQQHESWLASESSVSLSCSLAYSSGAKDWTQGVTHARQVFFYLAKPPASSWLLLRGVPLETISLIVPQGPTSTEEVSWHVPPCPTLYLPATTAPASSWSPVWHGTGN